MFGSVSEWFYKAIAGIKPAPDAVGFDKVIIQPHPVGDLTWAKATYDSVRGRIISEWSKEKSKFKLHVRIPVGAQATAWLPNTIPDRITESGQPVNRVTGVRIKGIEGDTTILMLDSGEYWFTWPISR
jgi:hypothetical protein